MVRSEFQSRAILGSAMTIDLEAEVRLQILQVLQLCGTGPAIILEAKKYAQRAMRI